MSSVLKEIKPSLKEQKEFESVAKDLVTKLETSIKKLNLNCKVFIGGSFGKGTYLKTSSDVDIFCRFNKSYEDNQLSIYLKQILTDAKIKFKLQKGSRDYYSGEYKLKNVKIKFEVVPVRYVEVAKDAINSTDVSALHVEFVKSKIKLNSKLSDEIRLTKQFFKAHKLYGAESYINAFSGHIIDILICYYGSLENLLLDAKSWNESHFIDINNFYKSKEDALKHIEKDKQSTLIVVDPIVKERNAARALSTENYNKFLFVANQFESFTQDDFKVKKESISSVLKKEKIFAKNNNLKFVAYSFDFTTQDDSEDIVGSKLLKLSQLIAKRFENYDFKVFKSNFNIDIKKGECLFSYHFEFDTLSNLKEVMGPKVTMKEAIKGFLKVRKNYFISNDRLYSYEKRKITKLNQITKLSLKDMKILLNKELKFVKKVTLIK